MPITLGCPSCGKRFKARDESAGKRVKCPYCGVPVTVPTPEEAASAAAPTMTIPPPPTPSKESSLLGTAPVPIPPPRSVSPPAPPTPAAVATPDDWGAAPPVIPPKPVVPAPKPVEPLEPPAFPMMARTRDLPKKEAKPKLREKSPTRDTLSKTADQLAAPGWKKARGGLFWVLFALFFFALPGFVGFAKVVLPRAGIELPTGEGWSVPGYINSEGRGTVTMKKEFQIDVLAYGTPLLLGGLALSFGRLTCAAAPRSSGAKGMFALSGLFTFLGLVALVTAGLCHDRMLIFPETYVQAGVGFIILASVAEFWFLTGLAVSGIALKRPKAARTVGFLGLVFAIAAAAIAVLTLKIYDQELRPKPINDELKL